MMMGGHYCGLSWVYVYSLKALLCRVAYLLIEVVGEFIPYHCFRLDGQPISMLRVCVTSIDDDGWSLLWAFLGVCI